MAFTLKERRSGNRHSLSVLEILRHIGDSINDEIIINEKVYLISSFQEQDSPGGSGTSIDWLSKELVITTNDATTFNFQESISDTDSIFLTVNNVLYQYGPNKDYHIQDSLLYWHGGFSLETSDSIIIKYPSITQ